MTSRESAAAVTPELRIISEAWLLAVAESEQDGRACAHVVLDSLADARARAAELEAALRRIATNEGHMPPGDIARAALEARP